MRKLFPLLFALGVVTCALGALPSTADAACPDPFCDSVSFTQCPVICPAGDIPFVVTVKDSCGVPVCDTSFTYLDFSNCPVEPCPGVYPDWPLVFPDSCDPATGEHFFTLKIVAFDCTVCSADLYINGQLCQGPRFRFLDINGSFCVDQGDFISDPLCNDYDCDGAITSLDQDFHISHLDHCCDTDPCQPGAPFCDSVRFDPCLTICPQGDIPWIVEVTDSCGNPVCDPNLYIELGTNCPAQPCPNVHPDWPKIFPDSCDPATGEHFFHVKASAPDCLTCGGILYVDGQPCHDFVAKFLDVTGDFCVFPDDWVGQACNDYDCDGTISAADQNIHSAHLDHCCADADCPPGPVFCDSVMTDPCLVICPLGDISHEVVLKDSCGNPICDPGLALNFANCAAEPCPGEHPDWPLVYADSCDNATGTHWFSVKASSLDCIDCFVDVTLADGTICRRLETKFLDINNDKCVTPNDWLGGVAGLPPCNDYNCDGVTDSLDMAIHDSHLDHCCADQCPPGPPFCDSVITDGCVVVCPRGDIVEEIIIKDSCGNPICDPNAWLDFSQCQVEPCPGAHPNWPRVYPDSCDPATGTHYFSVKASSYDCIDCRVQLFVDGSFCRLLSGKFLDINNDNCVTPNDWFGGAAGLPPCNDYNCDGVTDNADFTIHQAHLDHCCDSDPCAPGPPLCDSVTTDPCVLICPQGDVVHTVNVKDSCGNPFCDVSAVWLDFSNCAAEPCPGEHPNWPIVHPDSCDPATGDHFFSIRASSLDCVDCTVTLWVNGSVCRTLRAKFLDVDNDKCVTQADFITGALCSDYNCDGVVDSIDAAIHGTHFDHCCAGSQGSIHGHKFHDINCNGIWDSNEPPLANWQINLYQGGTFIASTTTNAAGEYWFMGLPSGSYRVTETVMPGWVQTYPPTVWWDTTLSAGGTITGLDFGNVEDSCAGLGFTTLATAGTHDNFVGAEPSTPGADLLPLMTCPLGSTNFFDSSLTNQCFGHTFTNFHDTNCCIIGAELCLRIRATGSIPGTDALVFAEDGQGIWGISLNTLQWLATGGADSSWSSGDVLEYCLDLENLPPNAIGITNVLAALKDNDFDIYIQDDTEVDWFDLRVSVCCPGCCILRGDANDDGPVNISDLTYLVDFLFNGGPTPPCFEEGDVNGDGVINVSDVTYLVAFLFQGGPPPPPCP